MTQIYNESLTSGPWFEPSLEDFLAKNNSLLRPKNS